MFDIFMNHFLQRIALLWGAIPFFLVTNSFSLFRTKPHLFPSRTLSIPPLSPAARHVVQKLVWNTAPAVLQDKDLAPHLALPWLPLSSRVATSLTLHPGGVPATSP